MSHSHFSIDVGTLGFQHPQWSGTFYDEDMPEEWRLEFYSHEFHTLAMLDTELPAPDALQQWLTELDENFTLLIRLSRPLDKQVKQALQTAGCYCGVIALRPELVEDDLPSYVPVELVSQLTDSDRLLHSGGVYSEDLQRDFASISQLRVHRLIYQQTLSTSQPLDLRRWKSQYSELHSLLAEHAMVHVVLRGEPPSLEAVRQLNILAQLMGW